MTKLQASSSEWVVTPRNFRRWCASQGIDLTGKKILHLWYKQDDPSKIERLEIVPNLTRADITKIMAKWPELGIVRDWKDPDNWRIP